MKQSRAILVAILAGLVSAPNTTQADEWLLQDVNVLAMNGEPPARSQDILITDSHIAAIADAGTLTTDGAIVYGKGAWVIPGLHDMHVHLGTEQMLAMYVANGVTSIRVMNGNDDLLEMTSRVKEHILFGPEIFLASPLLEGNPPLWPQSEPVTTPQQGRALVERYANHGYSAIKIYDGLNAPVLAAVVEAAEEHGLPVVGHMPDAVRLDQLLAHAPDSLEHVGGYLPRWLTADRSACDIPKEELEDLARRLAEAGVPIVPTLSLFHQLDSAESRERMKQHPEFHALPQGITQHFWPGATPKTGSKQAREADCKSLNAERFARALIGAGGRILAGTDTPNPWLIPGDALHMELERLVAAGMTPEQALASATVDAAAWFGDDEQRGTITVGKRADLVILEANPLEDIRNVGAITGVVLRGQWLPQTVLQQRWLPTTPESSARSPEP